MAIKTLLDTHDRYGQWCALEAFEAYAYDAWYESMQYHQHYHGCYIGNDRNSAIRKDYDRYEMAEKIAFGIGEVINIDPYRFIARIEKYMRRNHYEKDLSREDKLRLAECCPYYKEVH